MQLRRGCREGRREKQPDRSIRSQTPCLVLSPLRDLLCILRLLTSMDSLMPTEPRMAMPLVPMVPMVPLHNLVSDSANPHQVPGPLPQSFVGSS